MRSIDPFAFASAIVQKLTELGADVRFALRTMREIAQECLHRRLVNFADFEISKLGSNDPHLGFDFVDSEPGDFAFAFFVSFRRNVGVDGDIDGRHMSKLQSPMQLTFEHSGSIQKRPGTVQMSKSFGGIAPLRWIEFQKTQSALIVFNSGDLFGTGQGFSR
jgi:hypothetical protein